MRVSQSSSTDADLVGTMREGVLAQKHLLIGEEGSPINYDLNIGRAGGGGWRAPRHRHNFDQIRFVLKGNYPYGDNKVLPEGWVAYFPESVYYGPQDRPEGLETMVLQVGGASGQGYLSVAQREAANAALNKKGHFKGGLFVYTDEKGEQKTQDGSAACFEHATGRKLEFAPARYEDVVVMNPSAYAWIPQGAKGVEVKWLGSFTERNARIGFLRLAAGAVYGGGEHPSIEVLYLSKGKISVDGQKYGPQSALEFLPKEGPVPITAIEPTEFLCMVLHQF
ncbi:hypothetical protein [Bradyrhizobium sp. WSM2254]|uniref:hypothetical protein n=1 Tax=Bradyrhizobium sp. WSM2254 TaxID=1188263 RepID=UPI000480C2E5|nr:hypothetical protein [Bradyrhizobium sp. WSM2254]